VVAGPVSSFFFGIVSIFLTIYLLPGTDTVIKISFSAVVLTLSVLCVDDEASLLEICKLYLEKTNEFTVTTASSAPDALHLLKSNGIQAIVSDYQMPGMDGIAFLKLVRATNKKIPFIIFTGKGWEAIAIEAFENGADFYLQKGGAGTPAASYADLMHKIKMAVEQRRVDQALAESELQYRRLFETAQDAILILNGETGEVIDANKFILDMMGYPRDYFVGKHLWELGFIRDKAIAQQAFTELKTKGYIRYDDLPLETKDGRRIDVEFISNTYLVGAKKIIQCNIRNITERKAIQDALQVSETRYRRLFETAQDGILILDEETGKIIDANKFILDMLGYPLDHFVGKHLWEVGFIKDKSIAQQAFAELKTKGYIRYDDLPLETKDGRSMDVEFISNVYPVNSHKIIQCNIRNVTERKRSEAALALAVRKLNLLSSITRHDIRNQILALEGYLDISRKSLEDPARMSEYIAKEERITRTIAHQISFTKDYEEMGKTPLWQDINTVIRDVITHLPMRNIRFDGEYPGLEVFADPLLEKVFYNLFDNALRYGGEKMTAIRVKTREDNGVLVISIEDDGNGISPEDKEQLFTKGYGRNTGLGLYLSREILSITGITITETGEPGNGARFEMTVEKEGYRFSETRVLP
jgi:PAS domain S-box-containing protein